MKYSVDEVKSVGELLGHLKVHLDGVKAPVWFRGQADANWRLMPKFLRNTPTQSELYLMSKFKQSATLLLSHPPKNDFEWLYLMQHYAVPTRLLDWTESPLVALYFTIDQLPSSDGALWVLLPTVLNQKSNYRPDYQLEIPSFEDEHLKNYLPETVSSENRSRLYPMAALAPRNSARMQSQQGVFTISHREPTPIEDVGAAGAERDYIWKYRIPFNSKVDIRRELKVLGVSRFQLFPELDSLAWE